MDVPQLKDSMLHKEEVLTIHIMNVNTSHNTVRKSIVIEGTCSEKERVSREQPNEHSVSSLNLQTISEFCETST